MWFRLGRPEWVAAGRSGRKAMLEAIVEAGPPPGLLAYAGGEPMGWVAVAPREDHAQIGRSRIMRPVDDAPAHAVTCFYLAPRWRRRWLMRPLIEAAVAFARERGASLVEAYPFDPPPDQRISGGYHGIAAAFRDHGFVEVARRSPARPLMRLALQPALPRVRSRPSAV
jgi:GNAT superfamily N-acetyltransferase